MARTYDRVPCRSCNAPMIWVKMQSGKSNPLDAEPVENGTICINDNGIGEVLKGEDLTLARAVKKPLYVSHFATCPNAKKHRRA